jgi:4-hydroxy-tetrahydrodipicolinate reductase
MTRVHVHGASGRLGQAIVRVAESEGKYRLSLSGRNDDLAPLLADAEVAIDVSLPEGSLTIAEACAAGRKPLVIGTTGHSAVQLVELRSKPIPILLAPNFSVGVNLLFWLTEKAAAILGPGYDVGPRSENEIGMHAVRGGDIVGEHTIYFAGSGERLELTHRASSRETFARGALRAAEWLIGKPVGWYEMADVLGLRNVEER